MKVALLITLVAVAACSSKEHEAADVVRRYDDELIRAFRLGDVSGLEKVAMADEVRRVRVLIDLKAASKLVLESNLDSFRTISAKMTGKDAAVVETKERWRYFDRHLTPGEKPGPTFIADMAMRYDLSREGGGFKVRSATTLSSEYLQSGVGASR